MALNHLTKYILLLLIVLAVQARQNSSTRNLQDGDITDEELEAETTTQFAFGQFEESGSFWDGVYRALSLIFVSEIGDKTFFVVIIYSSKFNKLALFLLASFCMVFMHTLSTTMGTVLALILPKLASSIIVVILFLGFGIYLLVTTCK
jgi:hypothetical protein